jgi:hypothetical protein
MNASRAALMVVGVNLVAVWAAAAAGSHAVAPGVAAEPPQVVAEAAVGEASASLLAAAERLEAHARRDVAPAMVRDPFHFGTGARPSARQGPESAPRDAPAGASDPMDPAEAAAPPVEPEPDIVLQGMAESGEGESIVRTAILSAGGELVLATLGTRVAGRYDVVALTADSVELEDVVMHARRTWRLK